MNSIPESDENRQAVNADIALKTIELQPPDLT